ncbi:MAG: adenosylcobinamide amidohydrolase, partial [Candidatus Accumulibacter sp.]|nr:adenosylcobinamide amidohydrolase [Accumulibacter sp.]
GEDGQHGRRYIAHIHKRVAHRLGTVPAALATMGTAADMNNLAVAVREYGPFSVAALVTAGAGTNALRAGVDEGAHIEGEGKDKDGEPHGTINVLLLTNARLSEGAMAQAIVMVTEAKTAALEDLHVPSSYTKGAQATGTGTDSVIVVAGKTGPRVTYTGGHSRIGELIAKAVYAAVVEALGKQNGFLLPGAPPFVTENTRREKASVAAAEEWLARVDAGGAAVDQAWPAASFLLRRLENAVDWRRSLDEARAGLGGKIARRYWRSIDTRALPGLPLDDYMLVEFESDFEHRAKMVERVTVRRDEDGAWRVLRYAIRDGGEQ